MKYKFYDTFTFLRSHPWKFNPGDPQFVGFVVVVSLAGGRLALWNPRDLPRIMG